MRVARVGDQFRCRSDSANSQDQPCSHILAVLVYEGIEELPNTAAAVWKKSNEPRDHGLEARAWQQVPALLPDYLGRLLRAGLPVIEPKTDLGKRGRPFKPLYPQVYQAVIRVAERMNLNANRGLMQTPNHRQHNPYGGISRSSISRFLIAPTTREYLEKLLLLTMWPARPYEGLVHPDGTGLTEQRFTAFFEEKYQTRKEWREHKWTFAEFLWTYRYTMIAGCYAQQGPFGEAQWLLPLLERALVMLDLKELGGDKAYVANYVFEYARAHGIEAQIKFKKNANPGQRGHQNRAYKRTVEAARLDPEGYAAKANRRSNAEAGNHAFKAFLGDQIYSRNTEAQVNEILCMCIAYNLARLVLLSLDQGVEIDFTQGAAVLAKAAWAPLDVLHKSMTVARSKTRRLA
ncbi:MAG: transposase [Halobacteriales archaeon]|nr:transposase [Halobacteriales archaeon]